MSNTPEEIQWRLANGLLPGPRISPEVAAAKSQNRQYLAQAWKDFETDFGDAFRQYRQAAPAIRRLQSTSEKSWFGRQRQVTRQVSGEPVWLIGPLPTHEKYGDGSNKSRGTRTFGMAASGLAVWLGEFDGDNDGWLVHMGAKEDFAVVPGPAAVFDQLLASAAGANPVVLTRPRSWEDALRGSDCGSRLSSDWLSGAPRHFRSN